MKMTLSGFLMVMLTQPCLSQDFVQGVPQVETAPALQPARGTRAAPTFQHNTQEQVFAKPQVAHVLSNANLRDIDRLVVQLAGLTRKLHDEYHDHFEGIRHAEKLDEDVTELERMAEALHQFVINDKSNSISAKRLRDDTNAFIQHTVRIIRSLHLVEPWLRGDLRIGIRHMERISHNALGTALAIDRFLPVDTKVIDDQTAILEAAIKELHDEFHEHLEGYEVSARLDEDLEDLETLVEHMHELAHEKTWTQLDLPHLLADVMEVREETGHIESLFVHQSEIGVRTKDWIGIEHSRDAITDVLSSAYLLEHMIRKTGEPAPRPRVVTDRRPMRDRHGHIIQAPQRYHQRLRHNPHEDGRRYAQ